MVLRPCLVCGIPSTGTRCPAHEAPLKRADNARRHAKQQAQGRNAARWRALREQRLKQAGGFCELQVDRGCTTLATSVHLDPAFVGDHGRATIDDVRAACRHCHGLIDGARSQSGGTFDRRRS